MLTKGTGGLIEHNSFAGLGGGAVEFWNAPYEGPGAEDYVVRHNRIQDCCRIRRTDAPIWAITFKSGHWRGHRNILIENNEIAGFPDRALLLHDIEDVVIRHNRIDRGGQDAAHAQEGCVIETANAARVVIVENQVTPPSNQPVCSKDEDRK